MINESSVFMNNENTESNPYISELSYKNSIRKIRINTMKSNLIAIIILAVLQVALILLGIFLFENKALKIMFCTIQLPFILILAFAPGGTVCKYDYSTKTFSSCLLPTVPIPIPYMCFSLTINFQQIDGFYLQKVGSTTKKYYKIGVKDINGKDTIIGIGQDNKCQSDLDEKIKFIPFLLRAYLKP